MIIYYKLNDNILIDEKTYKIDASFNNILLVIELMEEPLLNDEEKINLLLELLINDNLKEKTLKEKEEICEEILKKYIDTKGTNVKFDLLGNPLPIKEEKFFDYKQDSDLIYSSFYQAYGIDLVEEQGKLHWLKFKALLNGLPPKTRLMDIIGIRMWNPEDEKKSNKQIMRDLKEKFRLKGGNNE